MKDDFEFISDTQLFLSIQKRYKDYQTSLRAYRDIKNSLDYAEEQGVKKSKENIARNLLLEKLPVELVAKTTKLSVEEVRIIKNDLDL